MVHSLLRSFHLDGDQMDAAIVSRRCKRKAIFMADELSDLCVCPVKVILGLWEVDPPACNLRKFAQGLVGIVKALLDERTLFFFLA